MRDYAHEIHHHDEHFCFKTCAVKCRLLSSLVDDVQLPRIHHGYFRNFNFHGKILLYNILEVKMLIVLISFFFYIFCNNRVSKNIGVFHNNVLLF